MELRLSTSVLMLTLLLIQFIAMGGALLFGRIAERTGAKHAIMITLVIWSGMVITPTSFIPPRSSCFWARW